jgi:agmatinase
MNYGGIEKQYTLWKKSRFVVLPIPYDLTSTYQAGSRNGPKAIIDASCNMELYDEELDRETYLAGIHTMPPLQADARGPKEMVRSIKKAVSKIIKSDKVPVILGGEHSISLGVVQALKEKYSSLSILHMDAHADMRDSYQGSPFSHACVARRMSELCPITQVGIRSMSAEEASFLQTRRIPITTSDSIRKDFNWIEDVCKSMSKDIYLSIDMDVFDPSLMPSTGTPEPDGLLWNDVLTLIRAVSRHAAIRGFDIVELSPVPGIVAPDFLAAKLIYRIMGYVCSQT